MNHTIVFLNWQISIIEAEIIIVWYLDTDIPVNLCSIKTSPFNNFGSTSSVKKWYTSGWSLYIILQNCIHWRAKTSMKLVVFLVSLFTTRVGKQYVCNGPICCSCRLCTALILDPAIYPSNRISIGFIDEVQKRGFQRIFYAPPLLKTLWTRATYLIKSLVALH